MTRQPEPIPTGPIRTCVGCRERVAGSDLLRVVAVTVDQLPLLQPDPRGVLLGRGAHVHPTEQCLGLAVRRRAFARALRLQQAPDATILQTYVAQWCELHQSARPESNPTPERAEHE